MVLGKDEIGKLAADGRLWVDLPTGHSSRGSSGLKSPCRGNYWKLIDN